MKEILTLLWLAWYKMFTETHLIIDSRRETKIFLSRRFLSVDSQPHKREGSLVPIPFQTNNWLIITESPLYLLES